jgi:hypothetical protein
LTAEEKQALIVKAKQALDALDASGEDYLRKMLVFGETAYQAKEATPHGEYKDWCQKHLNRSKSWVSNYRSLFEERAHLEDALAWARESDHKWACCRSVERLLKIIAQFKAKDSHKGDESEAAPKSRQTAKETIADLQQRLREIEEFVSVSYLLPPEVKVQVRAWTNAAATGDITAKDALDKFTQASHAQLRDLLADQTSSALDVSGPGPAAPKTPHPTSEKDRETAASPSSVQAPPRAGERGVSNVAAPASSHRAEPVTTRSGGSDPKATRPLGSQAPQRPVQQNRIVSPVKH